jgi:hypothetical protein
VYTFEIERLRAQQFSPTHQYIEANMQFPNIKKCLQDTQFRRDIYMITGVQIAHGGSIKSFSATQHGLGAQIGVNGLPVGVPLEVGPNLSSSSGKTEGISFGPAKEFVFAYRLKKVIYLKKTKSFKVEDHLKGTMLSHEDFCGRSETEASTTQEEKSTYAELVGLDEEEIGGEEFELQESMTAVESVREVADYVIPHDI